MLATEVTDLMLRHYNQETKDFYTSEYSVIYALTVEYYNTYNDLPSSSVIVEECRKLLNKDNGLLNKSCLVLEQLPLVDVGVVPKYIVDEVKNSYLQNTQHRIYSKALQSTNALKSAELVINELSTAISTVKDTERADEQTKDFQEFLEVNLTKLLESTGEDQGLSYGIEGLDKKVDRMGKAELIIIAAQPGVGKSLLSQHIAVHNCIYNGKRGVIANKEMVDAQMFVRIMSMLTGIPSKKYKYKERLSTQEVDTSKEVVKHYGTEMKENLLIIPPRRCQTVTAIRREIKARFGDENPDFIVVDYLNELSAEIPTLTGHEKIAYVTQKLKDLAIEFNCPVISPTQPNSEGYDAVIPTMNDVGYKSITQKADVILFLIQDKDNRYVEPISDMLPGTPGIVLSYIVKNRNGAVSPDPVRISVEYATANLADANADVLDVVEYVTQ
jgi:replicative DNA helicase